MVITMDQLLPGEFATVTDVSGDGAFRRRLLELGVLPGTLVTRTGQAPLGDPLSFRIRGAVLCLRRREASTIAVEKAVAASVEPSAGGSVLISA